mmetsp:Transcript_21977/g.36662  ORF Transcript_21977/g.36662 Transcript_21977/m.36662 type:complete len:509 (-) Transcript_21977:60-1586(-)|eukprot:CAMPEP_0198205372 /NCGR_PEP_ID=MMETSP1445-20131203/8918_1 /TAXON_ID=36898 /ORGANISM="Pyramimonas sp., Strain CCMP2087" /LENGTH=508 /DNA_ID=CAMNT_0043877665 /DNA_START=14 /DNA_END=1540 /DNA_ORIENTATION=-
MSIDYSRFDHLECSDTSDDEPDNGRVQNTLSTGPALSGDDKSVPSPTTSHIVFHPSDSGTGLNPLYLRENPHSFEPQKYERTGVVEAWGTKEQNENTGIMGNMGTTMRKMQAQQIYRNTETPEQQFVGILKKRKQKKLTQEKADRTPLYLCDFVLRIALVRLPEDNEPDGYQELQPSVWRRVQVAGGISLRTLHDRVIGPAMGWTRNYHGYVFQDVKDGAVFGPADSMANDMKHMTDFYVSSLPDTQTTLAQLVQAPGDELFYVYDLGDNWLHRLTVESVRAPREGGSSGGTDVVSGRVAVLGGDMACPPEDGFGLQRSGPASYEDDILVQYAHQDPAKRRPLPSALQCKIGQATNIKSDRFDPHAFRLEEAQERVARAIAGKASVRGGEMTFNCLLSNGSGMTMEHLMANLQVKSKKGVVAERHLAPGPGESEHTTRRFTEQMVRKKGKEPKGEAVCNVCGSPNDVKKCSECRNVYYCSRECQKVDWGRGHKSECNKKADKATMNKK